MTRLLRFSPLRLALGYIALGVVALGLLALPLWYSWRTNLATFKAYVHGSDQQRLVEVFDREGASGLTATITSLAASLPGGEILIFADPSRRLLAGNLSAWPAQIPAEPGTYGLVIDVDGGETKRVVGSHVVLPGGYRLLLARESVLFHAFIERFWLGIAGATLIVLVLGAAFGWLVRRGLLAEVHEISRAASAIAGGDVSRSVATRSGSPELGALAETVNGMLARLAGQNAQLEGEVAVRRQAEQALHRAHDELEGTVAQRTAELARANESLRLSEERYARAMEASDAGYWDWSVRTGEMFQSARMLEMLGFPPDARFADRDDFVARIPFHPDDREQVTTVIAAALEGGADRYEVDYRIVLPTGETRWVRARGKVYRDETGCAMRMVGFMLDVTDRRQAADELARLERQLRQVQRLEAMGTLAGGIAHDFNNILGAILGYGEMTLREAATGSRLRRDLDGIMTAAERGRALVERILAFSRSGAGERVAVHVEKLVGEGLNLLAAKLPAGVNVERRLRAGRAAVLGDPTQVHQVLMNLATNAVQAMPTGGTLRVSLDAVRLDATRVVTIGAVADGEYVALEVADSGIGIPPENVGRIFEPFFTTKDVGVGTGLGLSLVHGMVMDLGGAIDVMSTVGAGTTFTVYLPRAGDATEAAESEAPLAPHGNRERVLVVDDEAPLVRIATETLEELGYRPVGFTSSSAALAAFRADPSAFDVLVTDERMPGMPGSTLIREVRRIRAGIPTMLMSGFIGGTVSSGAREAGADEVLQKPLSARELAACLARVLHRARTGVH